MATERHGPDFAVRHIFLQSLSADEAVWFDHFSLPVVCPVFHVETLADLAKEATKRMAEEVVADIARKFPEWSGSPCYFRIDLCVQDLLGANVVMDGRIPRHGGRPVKGGTVFEHTPEEEAFQRWNNGKFLDVEKLAAAGWRKALAELDLKRVASELQMLGIEKKKCRTLEEARDFAREIVNGKDRPARSVRAGVPTVSHRIASPSATGRAMARRRPAHVRQVRALCGVRNDD